MTNALRDTGPAIGEEFARDGTGLVDVHRASPDADFVIGRVLVASEAVA
jgi:hypothetical protein